VRPQVDPIQFSKKTWQTVTGHALKELAFRESQDNNSRIENLRPFFFEEETEVNYGRQVWCFESMTRQNSRDRKIEYGVMEFSIEYGLIELIQCRWFPEEQHRELWIAQRLDPTSDGPSCCSMTKIWVYLAVLGVLFLALGWLVSLLRFLNVFI
jgi:hypothetical protein